MLTEHDLNGTNMMYTADYSGIVYWQQKLVNGPSLRNRNQHVCFTTFTQWFYVCRVVEEWNLLKTYFLCFIKCSYCYCTACEVKKPKRERCSLAWNCFTQTTVVHWM